MASERRGLAFLLHAVTGEADLPDVMTRLFGREGEKIECQAELRIRTSQPFVGPNGLRRVNLDVVAWEASGRSSNYGLDFRVQLRRDRGSYVDAVTTQADFPGRMQMRIQSDTYLGGRLIETHEGSAGGLISSFPPADGDIFLLRAPPSQVNLEALTGGVFRGEGRIEAIARACSTPA